MGLYNLLKSGKLKQPWEQGVVMHALADSYAHVQDSGDAYDAGIGHLLDMHVPDVIGHNPDRYMQYVYALYDAMGGPNLRRSSVLTHLETLAYSFGNPSRMESGDFQKKESVALERDAKKDLPDELRYDFNYVPGDHNKNGLFSGDPLTPDIGRGAMEALINVMEQYCGSGATGTDPPDFTPSRHPMRRHRAF